MKEVWDLVESPFAPGRVAAAPASPVVPTSEDTAGAAELEITSAKPQPGSPEDLGAIKKIEELLRDKLGEHATYREARADAIIRDCIEHCVTIAGCAQRCFEVFEAKLNHSALVEKLMSSATRLGGYIKQSFKGWYDEEVAAWSARKLDDICRGLEIAVNPALTSVFIDWLREKLGAHVLSVEQLPEEGGFIWIDATVTDRAKIACLLSQATGIKVSPDAVPVFVDDTTVKQAIAMIDDEAWATGLCKAKDPLHHFLTYREEVEVEDEHEEAEVA